MKWTKKQSHVGLSMVVEANDELKKYLDRLQRRLRQLDVLSRNSPRARMNLYQSLTFQVDSSDREKPQQVTEEDFWEYWLPNGCRSLLITGLAGAGKSALLESLADKLVMRLMDEIAQAKTPLSWPVPILVSLPALPSPASGTLLEQPAEVFLGSTELPSSLRDGVPTQLLLLLDGFDEISPSQRQRIARLLREWDGPFFLTSRAGYGESQSFTTAHHIVRLEPWSGWQQRRYCEAFFGSAAREDSLLAGFRSRWADANSGLIARLLERPLYLEQWCEAIHFNDSGVPRHVEDLIVTLLDELLRRRRVFEAWRECDPHRVRIYAKALSMLIEWLGRIGLVFADNDWEALPIDQEPLRSLLAGAELQGEGRTEYLEQAAQRAGLLMIERRTARLLKTPLVEAATGMALAREVNLHPGSPSTFLNLYRRWIWRPEHREVLDIAFDRLWRGDATERRWARDTLRWTLDVVSASKRGLANSLVQDDVMHPFSVAALRWYALDALSTPLEAADRQRAMEEVLGLLMTDEWIAYEQEIGDMSEGAKDKWAAYEKAIAELKFGCPSLLVEVIDRLIEMGWGIGSGTCRGLAAGLGESHAIVAAERWLNASGDVDRRVEAIIGALQAIHTKQPRLAERVMELLLTSHCPEWRDVARALEPCLNHETILASLKRAAQNVSFELLEDDFNPWFSRLSGLVALVRTDELDALAKSLLSLARVEEAGCNDDLCEYWQIAVQMTVARMPADCAAALFCEWMELWRRSLSHRKLLEKVLPELSLRAAVQGLAVYLAERLEATPEADEEWEFLKQLLRSDGWQTRSDLRRLLRIEFRAELEKGGDANTVARASELISVIGEATLQPEDARPPSMIAQQAATELGPDSPDYYSEYSASKSDGCIDTRWDDLSAEFLGQYGQRIKEYARVARHSTSEELGQLAQEIISLLPLADAPGQWLLRDLFGSLIDDADAHLIPSILSSLLDDAHRRHEEDRTRIQNYPDRFEHARLVNKAARRIAAGQGGTFILRLSSLMEEDGPLAIPVWLPTIRLLAPLVSGDDAPSVSQCVIRLAETVLSAPYSISEREGKNTVREHVCAGSATMSSEMFEIWHDSIRIIAEKLSPVDRAAFLLKGLEIGKRLSGRVRDGLFGALLSASDALPPANTVELVSNLLLDGNESEALQWAWLCPAVAITRAGSTARGSRARFQAQLRSTLLLDPALMVAPSSIRAGMLSDIDRRVQVLESGREDVGGNLATEALRLHKELRQLAKNPTVQGRITRWQKRIQDAASSPQQELADTSSQAEKQWQKERCARLAELAEDWNATMMSPPDTGVEDWRQALNHYHALKEALLVPFAPPVKAIALRKIVIAMLTWRLVDRKPIGRRSANDLEFRLKEAGAIALRLQPVINAAIAKEDDEVRARLHRSWKEGCKSLKNEDENSAKTLLTQVRRAARRLEDFFGPDIRDLLESTGFWSPIRK